MCVFKNNEVKVFNLRGSSGKQRELGGMRGCGADDINIGHMFEILNKQKQQRFLTKRIRISQRWK